MNTNLKTSIHNRFDIYSTNILTGETKQVAYAENIVLSQMWNRLCALSSYFVNIHYGTGTGSLSASRTSLFNYLGTKAAADDVLTKTIPTASWRRKIVLNPEDNVGSTLTEVGISYGVAAANLVTHALLKDMNGNQVSIVKTALDVLTIYGTVYVTFSLSDANMKMCGLPNNNSLMNYLVGGTAFPACYFYTGESPQETNPITPTLFGFTALGTSAAVTWTADTANKKATSSTPRLAVDASNGDISEVGFGSSLTAPIFRYTFPSALYSGLVLADVPVATGDAARKKFRLPSMNIDQSTIVIKKDGVTVSNYTKRTEGDCTVPRVARNTSGVLKGDTGYNRRLYWSRNSLVLACIRDTVVQVLDYSKTTELFTPRAALPTITGLKHCALSGDGSLLVVATTSSPYIRSFDYAAGAWTERSAPAVLPTGSAYACGISTNGLVLSVTHATSPFVTSYDWTAGAWVKRANPAVLPTGIGSDIFMSSNGLFMAIAHATSPFVTSYDWTAGAWVKRANPATLPASAGLRISATEDGLTMAVTHATTPYVSVYDWVAEAWIKRVDLSGLTAATGVRLFSAGNAIALSRNNTYYVFVYLWDGIAWSKRTDISSTAAGDGTGTNDVDVSYDEEIMTIGIVGSYGWADAMSIWSCKGYSTMLEFDAAPAAGSVLTASYTVKGIHKTIQRVIDFNVVLTFGEPV